MRALPSFGVVLAGLAGVDEVEEGGGAGEGGCERAGDGCGIGASVLVLVLVSVSVSVSVVLGMLRSGKAGVGSVRGGNGGDQGGVEGSVGGERVVGWLAPRPGSWLSSRDGAVAFPLAIVEPLSPTGAVASSAAGAVPFSPVAASSEARERGEPKSLPTAVAGESKGGGRVQGQLLASAWCCRRAMVRLVRARRARGVLERWVVGWMEMWARKQPGRY